MAIQLWHYLVLSGVLFGIGAAGFLFRRNALVALMCIELMLNAVNLTLVAFNRWQRPRRMPTPAYMSAPATPSATTSATNTASANTAAPAADTDAPPEVPTMWMIPHRGQVFAFFVIAVAAAEAAVGLAIVLSLHRLRKTIRTDEANLLKR